MSTQTSPPAAGPQRLTVVSHTGMIYWWPVWLLGFLLAGTAYAEGNRLAVVPAGTTVKEVEPGKVYELTVGGSAPSLAQAATDTANGTEAFAVRIGGSKNYGIVYVAVVLLVVFGSNVPLR